MIYSRATVPPNKLSSKDQGYFTTFPLALIKQASTLSIQCIYSFPRAASSACYILDNCYNNKKRKESLFGGCPFPQHAQKREHKTGHLHRTFNKRTMTLNKKNKNNRHRHDSNVRLRRDLIPPVHLEPRFESNALTTPPLCPEIPFQRIVRFMWGTCKIC